jgi:hypothetical protein
VLLPDIVTRTSTVSPRLGGGVLVHFSWVNSARGGLSLSSRPAAACLPLGGSGEQTNYGVLDPSAFRQDGGPSLGVALEAGPDLVPAAKGALLGDARVVMTRPPVAVNMRSAIDRPMLVVFSTCADLIRTLPVLQHDLDDPEDLNTDSEDHAADDIRYACMSRPWIQSAPTKKDTRINPRPPTMDELWKEYDKQKQFIGNRI